MKSKSEPLLKQQQHVKYIYWNRQKHWSSSYSRRIIIPLYYDFLKTTSAAVSNKLISVFRLYPDWHRGLYTSPCAKIWIALSEPKTKHKNIQNNIYRALYTCPPRPSSVLFRSEQRASVNRYWTLTADISNNGSSLFSSYKHSPAPMIPTEIESRKKVEGKYREIKTKAPTKTIYPRFDPINRSLGW